MYTRCGAAEGHPLMPFRTRTIDCDGNALGENIAVSTDKSRDLGEAVVLEVLLRRLFCVGLDNLDLEVIGLGHGEDGRGAGVRLEERELAVAALSDGRLNNAIDLPRRCKAFRTPFSLALQVQRVVLRL